jgi:hypothetical protein
MKSAKIRISEEVKDDIDYIKSELKYRLRAFVPEPDWLWKPEVIDTERGTIKIGVTAEDFSNNTLTIYYEPKTSSEDPAPSLHAGG